MSKCCKAKVIIDEDGVWCDACNRSCEIDYDAEYVIKQRGSDEYLVHFECGSVTNKKEDILQRRCAHCSKYLK